MEPEGGTGELLGSLGLIETLGQSFIWSWTSSLEAMGGGVVGGGGGGQEVGGGEGATCAGKRGGKAGIHTETYGHEIPELSG